MVKQSGSSKEYQNKSLKSYLIGVVSKYRIYFCSLFCISIIASLFEISVRYKVKEIIDEIAGNQNADLAILLMLFIFYKFMSHGIFFIARLLDIKYKPGFTTKITTDIYQKTIKHSLYWFDSHMSGEIADKINSIHVSMSHVVGNVFKSLYFLSTIIVGIIFLAKVHYLPLLVQLLFFLIYTPIICFLLGKQLKLEETYERHKQRTTGIINDSIVNIFGIKVIGNLLSEFKLKLTPSLLERQEWDKKTKKFDAFWVDNADTLMIVSMSAVQIYLLAYLYQMKQITAGGFAFIAMTMLKLHDDIMHIINYILYGINPQIAAIKASYKFINEEYDVVDKKDAKTLRRVKGEVEFKNVCFSYEDGSKKILHNFSLKMKQGEKIGLVGHSGAGKSTLIKTLIRYFDVDDGHILIDGNNIKDVTQESLRDNIAVIPQDITMFHRSILENLRIAKYEANKEEVIQACKKARIHNDILGMKKGYDSIVGERGIKVSGGQRQRIAIARAILKDSPILILDEATSSLDSKTEKMIQESLNLLMEDKAKTVIAIAHRLSTLKHMDRIIVMDKGKIVEIGTHYSLLRDSKSLYKKLWDLQNI
ncbi:MAG: ABC transporter ATP-binding protein [Rickettsiales bacterium]|nr:ABC transporter ATP-binding protein [Rickettsiales bacterium]